MNSERNGAEVIVRTSYFAKELGPFESRVFYQQSGGRRELASPCPADVRSRRRGVIRLAVPVGIDVVDVRALPVERVGEPFGAAPEVRLQALPRLPEVEALHVLVSLLAGAPEVLDVPAPLHLPELAEVRLGLHRRGDFRLVLRDPVERADVVLPVIGEEPVDPVDGVRNALRPYLDHCVHVHRGCWFWFSTFAPRSLHGSVKRRPDPCGGLLLVSRPPHGLDVPGFP